ncbi:MAG: acyltransferase family protein [Fulvimarina manganoxydans]|uniref:acyltransferase family protein n=1 Tax=Fulvimarina manganoxydans TaxID=937218 RepID=UPI0023525D80|nr:acyltransferase family protein [Fulvimarina manganoxydans]MCK5932391.1 acyltransferase family protein [Fulvimarina manganoxydans]
MTRITRDEIYAARGIGIMLVVFGHLGVTSESAFAVNVYLFHMPFFFFLGGMTLRPDKGLRSLLIHDGQALVLYTVFRAGLLASVSLALIALIGVTLRTTSPVDWRTWLVYPFTQQSNHVALFVVGWFMTALFATRVTTYLIIRLLGPRAAFFAALALGWAGMTLGPKLFAAHQAVSSLALSQIAVGTFFALAGYLSQRRAWPGGRHGLLPIALGLYLALIVLIPLFALPPTLSMAFASYDGGFFGHSIVAFLGIGLVIALARILVKMPLLQRIGMESRAVMTWHLTIAVLVTATFASLGRLPMSDVSTFVVIEPNTYWPLYLALGTAIPVSLAFLGDRLGGPLASRIARGLSNASRQSDDGRVASAKRSASLRSALASFASRAVKHPAEGLIERKVRKSR